MQAGDKVTIEFEAAIRPIKPYNTTMTLCKCYVLATGKNAKRINISKDAVNDAIPTLGNVPVVGHIYFDDEGEQVMGGHDRALVRNSEGELVFKKLTVPYGVIPQVNNAHYETVKEKDGTEKEYLVSDMILWTKMYPELLDVAYNEDVYFNQSMEIEPIVTEKMRDGYIDFKKYQYEALCLLGKRDDSKNVAPCFPSAVVQPYFSATDIWDTLFAQFKAELAESYGKENKAEGENGSMKEEFRKILSEFGLSETATLPFEITDEMTEEELREKLKEANFDAGNGSAASGEGETGETAGEESNEESNSVETDANEGALENGEFSGAGEAAGKEPETEPAGKPAEDFSLPMTAKEKDEVLRNAVSKFETHTEVGDALYWLIDYTDESVIVEHTVYLNGGGEVTRETLKAPYAISEDRVVSIAMDEAQPVRLCWLTKEEEDRAAQKEEEYQSLIIFKREREEEDKRREYAAVISEFSDLAAVPEYKDIVSKAVEFSSADALKEKLYAVRGKTGIFKKTKSNGETKYSVNFSKEDTAGDSDERKFYQRYLPQGKK